MFNDRKIAPCLWFNDEAEQAATFYTSVFPNSKIRKISHAETRRPSSAAG